MTSTALTYLLGVVDAGRALPDSPWPLSVTEVGPVAAVHAGIAPSALEMSPEITDGTPLAELARWHDDVLRQLAADGPVLPARLGSIVGQVDALPALLARQVDVLVADLERVRGRTEWTLHLVRTPRAVAEQANGADYLRSRRADVQAERRLAEAIAAMHEALAALADEVTGGPARAFLVPDAAAFLAAADEWAATLAAADCTMQLAGPLPPYHFVRLELGGA